MVPAVTEREAYLVLNMLNGIGPVRLAALLEFTGSAEGIFTLPEKELLRIPGISESLAYKLVHWEDSVDLAKEMRMIERGGVELLIRSDENYPAPLREIHDAPVCLYVRGKLPDAVNTRAIAMVGTRNATHYGEMMARRLAESASYANWVVVSGLAVGIDTIAHRATVNAGGKTVAVLGSGIDVVYPKNHARLMEAILEEGGFVQRTPCGEDKRIMRLYPTEKTLELLPRITQIRNLTGLEIIFDRLISMSASRSPNGSEKRSVMKNSLSVAINPCIRDIVTVPNIPFLFPLSFFLLLDERFLHPVGRRNR